MLKIVDNKIYMVRGDDEELDVVPKNADGTIAIDATMCNGCGLCMQLCKFDAIKKQAR